ncbi:hypothetical protein [Caulobacter sp. 17J65-9]|uniref:hypothetical protein n=1 Tax=Caulobacter sp. 17J65-9 TaxID=2709382 RepID=UPI0013C81AAC|nr:hypothetical protein [Caulobacter sp. 17J65-9]NEX93279.1 hypothetical protein [Caulobacter sp. 17J65-9]
MNTSVRAAGPGFAAVAAGYTVIYAAAVAADHLTTLAITAQGGIETNFLFDTAGGGLAEFQAWSVFLALWPVLLAMVWIGRTRAIAGRDAVRLPWLDPLWGAGAAGPLLLPTTMLIVKSLAGLLNLLLVFRLGSAAGSVRTLLDMIGLAEPKLVYMATAGLMLAVSVVIARPLASAWARRMAGEAVA